VTMATRPSNLIVINANPECGWYRETRPVRRA
jgi:hypothetical protein